MSIDLGSVAGILACVGAVGYLIYERRKGPRPSSVPAARDIPPRRLKMSDLERSFKPTGKTGDLLFARSEDGSRQVTAQWTEYAAEGLVHLAVSFIHNKHALLLTEDLSDPGWSHKADNLSQVCCTEMIREVQRGGPYMLRRLRDEWIAENKHGEAKPGEQVESSQMRFYLDGRRAIYVRSQVVR